MISIRNAFEKTKIWFKYKFLYITISIAVVSLIVFIVRTAFKINSKLDKTTENLECDSTKFKILNIVLTILIIFITIFTLPKYFEKIYKKCLKLHSLNSIYNR